jgi:hypothetical protein
MPLGQLVAASVVMSTMDRASFVGRMAVTRPAGAVASTTVFHCWHSPQRPTHLGLVQPHSVQRKVETGLAMRQA